jgi:hypothetical protein
MSTDELGKIQKTPIKNSEGAQDYNGLLFGHSNYTRMVVVGYARTGSNYLLDGITSSKSVRMYHEIFAEHNREPGKDFDRIFAKLLRKHEKSVKVVGFKLFYYHLTESEWTKFLRHDEFKVIHLTRRNRLRTILSLEIAMKTNQWKIRANSNVRADDRRVHLDPGDLVERIATIQRMETETRERFKCRPLLEVVYEDLITDPIAGFQRISEFLNLTDIDPRKNILKKQNPEGIKDLIINFSEVAQSLAGTPYEEYLNT